MASQPGPQTVIQFNLRSIVIATAVIGLVLPFFIQLIRFQPAAFRKQLLWAILLSSIFAGAYALFLFACRWRLEKRGGKLLYLPKGPNFLEYIHCTLTVILFVAFPLLLPILMWNTLKNLSLLPQGLGLQAIGCLLATTAFAPPLLGLVYTVTRLWWRVTPLTLEIRENGVGFGGFRFVPWNAITESQWHDGKHGVRLTLLSQSRKYVAILPFGSCEPVQQLLETKGVQ